MKKKRKRKFITWFSVFCMVFPRFFVAYAFYGLPSVFAVKFTYKKTAYLFLVIVLLVACWIISSQVAHISLTGFLLELVLEIPFLMFLLQFQIKDGLDALRIVRLINVAVFLLSCAYMTQFGFPMRLPYINFIPDDYSAFYFRGGAKIITIIGFFGIAAEFFVPKERRGDKLRIFTIIALLNFLVPSYLIGIVMGVGALGLVALLKKPALIPLLLVIVLIIAPYFVARDESLNSGFAANVGMNPKVFAYYSILLLYSQFPSTVLFGTGLGAFSSEPALWSSTYISATSTHSIPKLPGFFMSQYHSAILGPILSTLGLNIDTIESSANKPYTSVSTIFNEYGLFLSVCIMVLAFNAFKKMKWSKKYTITIAAFSVFIFTTDQWHDSLFFGYMLLLSSSICTYAV